MDSCDYGGRSSIHDGRYILYRPKTVPAFFADL